MQRGFVRITLDIAHPSKGCALPSTFSCCSSFGRAFSSGDGFPQRSRRWMRGARARAVLARDELLDRGLEWRDHISRWSPQRIALGANAGLENAHRRWRQANADFDKWFNAEWPLLQQRTQSRWSDLKTRLVAGGHEPPLLDTPGALLLGAGVGGIQQGYPAVGGLILGAGIVRVVGIYVVGRLDSADVDGLFRFAPERFRRARLQIFERLSTELSAYRKFKSFADYARERDVYEQRHKAMDPKYDYTPEKLYEDAMKSVAAHPRVQAALGPNIHTVAEPDKVVYRVHEEVTEVYLAWQVSGSHGKAEIQVKATACLLDFIYVFPTARGRFGLEGDGFVIRQEGAWSQDYAKVPKYQKKPFGKHNGRIFPHRDGVFDWDYEVKEFRHGWEDGKLKYRKGFSSTASDKTA